MEKDFNFSKIESECIESLYISIYLDKLYENFSHLMDNDETIFLLRMSLKYKIKTDELSKIHSAGNNLGALNYR